MLDRVGDEVARATSIVRYAPESSFSAHTHDGGEEFFVLEGVFQDEHGDYPAGCYVRNPPTSSHTPGSKEGCIIFVKLHQFDSSDRRHVQHYLPDISSHADLERPGVRVTPLNESASETVQFERIEPGTSFMTEHSVRHEILVVAGQLNALGDTFVSQSWMRLPAADSVQITAGPDGADVWVKSGHISAKYTVLGADK